MSINEENNDFFSDLTPDELEHQEKLQLAMVLRDVAYGSGGNKADYVHLETFLKEFVITQDEHDPDNPFKPLPIDTKPYLLSMAKQWVENPMIVIAKSRQVMATWLFCGCFLWDAMFRSGRLNILVSKKEEDADKLLSRIKGIYSRLKPVEFWHNVFPAKKSPGSEFGSYCKLEFKHNQSRIIGLSQDPNAIRQETASNILSDEMAFQERARETFIAMKPTLDGGGRFVGVSTPNGKEFFHSLFNNPDNGIHKIRIHWSQDLKKDEKWFEKARMGMDEDAWQQEQEINFTRAGGNAMYPTFEHKIHVKSLQVVKNKPLLCGIDFGYRHPALVIAQITQRDQLAALREYMPKDIEVYEFGKQCLRILKEFYPWHFRNRGTFINWYCDPAGNQRNDKSEKTSIQILREKLNIFCRFKQTPIMHGVTIIRELLKRRSDMTPGLIVDKSCQILIEGFMGGYEQRKTKEGSPEDERPLSDPYYSHTQDALREIVVNKFKSFSRPYNPFQQSKDEYDPFDIEEVDEIDPQRKVTGYY